MGRSIVKIETDPGASFWNLCIHLDNGEWLFVEPRWTRPRRGGMNLHGLWIFTSWQRRAMSAHPCGQRRR